MRTLSIILFSVSFALVFFVAVTAAFLRGAVEELRNALLLQSRDSQQYDPRNAIHLVFRAL